MPRPFLTIESKTSARVLWITLEKPSARSEIASISAWRISLAFLFNCLFGTPSDSNCALISSYSAKLSRFNLKQAFTALYPKFASAVILNSVSIVSWPFVAWI